MSVSNDFASIIRQHRAELLSKWTANLAATISGSARGRISSEELAAQASQFFEVLMPALDTGTGLDIDGPAWLEVRAFLDDLSKRRVLAGFSSDETATFIFSLKKPVFDALKGGRMPSQHQAAGRGRKVR